MGAYATGLPRLFFSLHGVSHCVLGARELGDRTVSFDNNHTNPSTGYGGKSEVGPPRRLQEPRTDFEGCMKPTEGCTQIAKMAASVRVRSSCRTLEAWWLNRHNPRNRARRQESYNGARHGCSKMAKVTHRYQRFQPLRAFMYGSFAVVCTGAVPSFGVTATIAGTLSTPTTPATNTRAHTCSHASREHSTRTHRVPNLWIGNNAEMKAMKDPSLANPESRRAISPPDVRFTCTRDHRQHKEEEQSPKDDHPQSPGVDSRGSMGKSFRRPFQSQRMNPAQAISASTKNEMTSRRWRARSVNPFPETERRAGGMSAKLTVGIPAQAAYDQMRTKANVTRIERVKVAMLGVVYRYRFSSTQPSRPARRR